MSAYGASFVRVTSEHGKRFEEVCQLLELRNRTWLAASPEHLAVEHTVRLHSGSPWLSVQNAVDDETLQRISRELSTETLNVHATDEHQMRFHYRHCSGGEVRRALDYADDPAGIGLWTTVQGEAEAWETLLFEPQFMALHEKYAPAAAVADVRERRAIISGASIPWACDGRVIDQIATRLELPWHPLRSRFLASTRSEKITGSPQQSERFHRRHGARRWWKFW